MYTYRDRPFVEARRVYLKLLRVNAQSIREEMEMMDADYRIDYGEFASMPDPTYQNAYGVLQERLLVAVADAFGIDPNRLDDCMFELEQDEARLLSPSCPFHERGLECRNSAPAGIDADGELYGDRGCGCNAESLRTSLKSRLRIRDRRVYFDPQALEAIAC